MNLLKEIKHSYHKLTKQQKMIADYFAVHYKIIDAISIKKVATDCNVSPSTITKVCNKIGFEGFKDMIKKTYNSTVNDDDKESFNARIYQKNLCDPIIKTLSEINLKIVKKVSREIIKEKRLVIIFASGKTLILAKYMFSTFLDMHINVKLIYDKYDPQLFDIEGKIIFVLSASGFNSQIKEYLKKVALFKPYTIIGITGSQKTNFEKYLDYHLHGSYQDEFVLESKRFPMTAKYILLLIIDQFILDILNYI
ncbi:MurR/RpiR family transcriptional regulator [Mesoplasma syrphidae]|uniref:MurR/RpiR family transcriptional regulator n=1 Tax=Mesoplasma syrphidae TaxID=225999 RepID=A0A2K9CC49_9MOLU|nr:MurR/RpiR family transcriptional regulator [Mesoplasma syrphidae]AUF83214.1 MurR/RpiR family transcriptional regulator [Mesoplasma syrphidae]